MSDGIPLLDSWITKATVARDALAKAEERIHELEAKLTELREHHVIHPTEWKARAEKAESHFKMMEQQLEASEARVAELERTIRENADASRPASETGPSRHSRRTDTRSPGAQFEAREREAD